MAKGRHQVSQGIIVGVSVLLIGTVANWLFPPVLAITKSVLAWVFGLLGTPTPLWVWLLGFVLSVGVIFTKRRLARWIDGSHEVVEQTSNSKSAAGLIKEALQDVKEVVEETSSAESISQPLRRVQEPKEPELDEVQMESVGAEEYDDEEEEEEEEDWRSYTSDNILDIDWRWRWHGTSIESLTAHCPDCDFELYPETSRIDATGIMTGEYLQGFRCEDEDCGWSVVTPSQYETLDGLHDYVKKYIRREARRLGLDRDGSP